VNNKIAFIFPGQGAQKVKMGLDFFQNSPAARAVFEKADDVLGESISTMIFEADEKELALTKNSQIAIYVTSMAILAAICERFPFLEPMICAGLSLGEYSALTAAQMVSFKEMLFIVQARGNFMHEATLAHPGTMAAILGLELEKIEKVVSDLQQNGVSIWVANISRQIYAENSLIESFIFGLSTIWSKILSVSSKLASFRMFWTLLTNSRAFPSFKRASERLISKATVKLPLTATLQPGISSAIISTSLINNTIGLSSTKMVRVPVRSNSEISF
jgi:hypothetical protein